MGQSLTAGRGTDRDWQFTARNARGSVVTTLLNTDTYAGAVWIGDDQAPLFAPSVSLVDGTLGTWKLSIAAADTAALPAGDYLIRATVARSGRTAVLYDGVLSLTAAPGSAVPRPAYATADDVRRWCPWLGQAEDLRTLQGNFAEELAEARDWTDDLIQRHYRGSGGLTRQQNLIMGVGIGGGGLAAQWRTGRTSPFLTAQLAANHLLLTTSSGKKIVRANAYFAAAMALGGRPDQAKKGDRPFADLSSEFYGRAEDTLATVTAELDTDGDGQPDVTIELGTIDVMRG